MINFVLNNMFDIIIMNKVLRGSLIQRPESIPQPTLMSRKERMWHAEHFGEVTEEDVVGAAKEAGESAKDAANSEEAKIAGIIAKGTGKEILKIVKEGVKILASSTAGIAIFSGILLAMEKTLSPEQLFKTTRMVFLITTAVSFGGAIVTYLMNTVNQTLQTSEVDKIEDAAAKEEKAASAEMYKAIAASMASDTLNEASSNVPDSVKEGVSETSSVIEESVITSQ